MGMRFGTWNIIIKWILKIQDFGCGLNSSGSGYGPVAGSYEYHNEPSGTIKNPGEKNIQNA
jgi:hypothetical protein